MLFAYHSSSSINAREYTKGTLSVLIGFELKPCINIATGMERNRMKMSLRYCEINFASLLLIALFVCVEI